MHAIIHVFWSMTTLCSFVLTQEQGLTLVQFFLGKTLVSKLSAQNIVLDLLQSPETNAFDPTILSINWPQNGVKKEKSKHFQHKRDRGFLHLHKEENKIQQHRHSSLFVICQKNTQSNNAEDSAEDKEEPQIATVQNDLI